MNALYGRNETSPHQLSHLETDVQSNVNSSSSSSLSVKRLLEVSKLTLDSINVIFTLLSLFGMDLSDQSIDRSRNHTHQRWMKSISLIDYDWMKFIKWKLAAFFHFHTAQVDSPPPPPQGITEGKHPGRHLLCGKAGRYLNSCLHNSSDPEYNLNKDCILTSLLQVKRGLPRPGQVEREVQLRNTFNILTTPRPSNCFNDVSNDLLLHGEGKVDWGHPVLENGRMRSVLNQENVCEQLNRTVDELFKTSDWKGFRKSRDFPFFPSTSGCIGNGRKTGGSFAALQEMAMEGGFCNFKHAFSGEIGESLLKISGFPLKPVYHRAVPIVESKYNESTTPYVIYSGPINDESRETPHHPSFDVDDTLLHSKFEEFYNSLIKLEEDHPEVRHNPVEMVALSEALKVRVITKSRPWKGFLLQPVQRFLFSTISTNPVFQLLTQPVDPWYMQSRLGAKLPSDEFYLSGDYSAATDNLAPWVSECIVKRIHDICEFDPTIYRLFLDALIHHDIEDPDDEESSKPQVWGQLMGSIVSFPILCIANAALCRWSIELSKNKILKLRDTSLMVNGDDCAFRTTIQGFHYWKSITTFAGLTPSIGKFFLTRDFVQINSTNFKYLIECDSKTLDTSCGVLRNLHFKEIKYINTGLLYGLKRSGEMETEKMKARDGFDIPGNGLSSRAHDLIRMCPYHLRCKVFQLFININKEKIKQTYGNLPWFIPEKFGGVGLPIFLRFTSFDPSGSIEGTYKFKGNQSLRTLPGIYPLDPNIQRNWSPSSVDLRVMHSILKENMIFDRIPNNTVWTTRNDALMRLPKCSIQTDDQKIINTSERLTNLLSIDTFFTMSFKLPKKNSSKVYYSSFYKAIHRNQKLWSSLVRRPLNKAISLKSLLIQLKFQSAYVIGKIKQFENKNKIENIIKNKYRRDVNYLSRYRSNKPFLDTLMDNLWA